MSTTTAQDVGTFGWFSLWNRREQPDPPTLATFGWFFDAVLDLDQTLVPGAVSYAWVYREWALQGSAQYVEHQDLGWLRSAMYPDGGEYPTYTLVASHPGTTSENLDSGITGLGREMVQVQRSVSPRGTLPKESV